MNFMNEASWDRIGRVVLGIAMMVVGFGGILDGALGTVVGVVGLIPLLTGLVGWCPIYAILRFRTRPDTRQAV